MARPDVDLDQRSPENGDSVRPPFQLCIGTHVIPFHRNIGKKTEYF